MNKEKIKEIIAEIKQKIADLEVEIELDNAS